MHRLARGFVSLGLLTIAALTACGGGGGGSSGSDADAAPPLPDGGPVTSCDPPGRFGVPEHVFELPATGDRIYYEDIQAAFPEVDWQTLDRLYVPAGQYRELRLGNLPSRTPERPLVITNKGGQVLVGHNPQGNFIWAMGGGKNWILTGRYDELSQTGDAAFPGHACGNYADSQGRYGFMSDDAYAFSAPYLHMGIGIGDASEFELEYLEVTRSGFAGIRLLNHPDGGTDKPMVNVRVHDTYVHDTAGEGYYFGWTGGAPSNLFPGLQIYNNRILRTGNEALQIQDVGPGSVVRNNTIIGGGLRWLDNGLGRYQDNLSQISVREGDITIEDNVFIDGAGSLVSFWTQPQGSDGARHVTFARNYFAGSLSLGVYMGGNADAQSGFTFEDNVFRDFVFGYTPVDPAATDPGNMIAIGYEGDAPLVATGNRWAGGGQLVRGLDGGEGMVGRITATGNTNEAAPAIALRNPGGGWFQPGKHLTSWAPNITVREGSPAMTYRVGDLVTYGDAPDIYECTAESSGTPPADAPGSWTKQAAPVDDVRVAEGSPYAGLGVQ